MDRKVAALVLVGVALLASVSQHAQTPKTPPPQRPAFTLTTTSFEDGGVIPTKYSEPMTGTPDAPAPQWSPELAWSNVPDGTTSFVLIMEDADNAMNHRTDVGLHWMMFNIPAAARELPEGVPAQAQRADGSIAGYLGPGAGAGGPYHHYTFSLYALDTKLDLGTNATESDVLSAMQGHVLRKGFLVGRFRRTQEGNQPK